MGYKRATDNMKAIQKKWLSLILLTAVTIFLPACKGNNIAGGCDVDDDDENLVGVITLKMKGGSSSGVATTIGLHYDLLINEANNFKTWGNEFGSGKIVDMGKRTLSQIKFVPSSGWSLETAVLEKHGYIYKEEGCYPYQPDNKFCTYFKVYVTKYITDNTGTIIGAEVRYCEWDPEK